MQKRRPVMLVVLDGWGWREEVADNAIRQARTPSFDRLWASCPHAFLRTSGKDVGLPEGQMGNSEVGHLNIGAGRLVVQDLPRIDAAIASGDIGRAPALNELIEAMRRSGGACHLIGLVSPGGVHSHQDHAAALANILVQASVPAVLHAFTDGRDTPPRSAGEDIARLIAGLPRSTEMISILFEPPDSRIPTTLPILVFNFKKEGNIERAIAGEPIGTWVANIPRPRPVSAPAS